MAAKKVAKKVGTKVVKAGKITAKHPAVKAAAKQVKVF